MLFGPQEPWLWNLMKTDMTSCTVTGPARTKPPESEAMAQCPGESHATWPASAAEAEPPEFFAFKECQDLFRKRLREPMLRLIPQTTGLRLHVLWHGPLDFQELGAMPVLCPIARQRAGAKRQPSKRCASCLRQCWKLTSRPANRGRQFIGQCGITNFRACLQLGNVRPLTLVLQAMVALGSPAPRGAGQGRATRFRAGRAGKPVSLTAFNDAVALARLLLHDLESTAQARMARSGLASALRQLSKTQIEAARLRVELRQRLPGLPESTVQPGLGSHARKIVEAMLDYVRQHYHRPIGLGELASDMKMNASYLSSLFSQTTGVTFHQFLEEVRLSKARELLRDPRNRICEVACATGYASPDSFRRAFKAHDGRSPEAWRAGQ
jgi:AraC-like DNA-binding protein